MNTYDPYFADLSIAAYENAHAQVFHAWLHLSDTERIRSARDRYTFYAICTSLPAYIQAQKTIDLNKTTALVDSFVSTIVDLSNAKFFNVPEWFSGVEQLVSGLTTSNYITQARHLVAQALRCGVHRYPRLHQSFNVQAAYLDSLIGRPHHSAEIALRLVRRPYLLPSRKELPAVCFRLMNVLAKTMHLREYRLVMWTGVSSLSASNEQRDSFCSQIIKTYRGSWRALLHADVPLKFRIPFFFLVPARALSGWRVTGALGLDEPFRWAHLIALFVFDRLFFRKNELFQHANREGSEQAKKAPRRCRLRLGSYARRILVTRAMGGLGDILMMTPGLRALSRKFPNATIHFALPKTFHPLLLGLDRVECIDIDNHELNLTSYHRWINLTDCPAARVESRQYPNVRANRIEIFARAMGLSKWDLKRYGGFRPHYFPTEEEREEAAESMDVLNPKERPLIALQPLSVDTYKNWSGMQSLAQALSKENSVLVFHNEEMPGYDGENIHFIKAPFRKAAALLSCCDHLVAIDSVFVHLGAALGIPTTAIFGPTSGKVFCRHYPHTRLIRPQKKNFPCAPCWRNEHIPCHLTQGRESICMRSITVQDVIESIKAGAPSRSPRSDLFTQALSWLRYGTE